MSKALATPTDTPAWTATWDVFCRVIDNLGDIGTCWRLARALAARGHRVRLWTDDASSLAWMAPDCRQGPSDLGTVSTWTPPTGRGVIHVHHWEQAAAAPTAAEAGRVDPDCGGPIEPGDVVIEAFACDPPPEFVARMARRPTPPVWINLEYLSAEAWVARCHGLPSPQLSGPGRGLTKWFFHPGFTPDTGGMLREPGLAQDRAAWNAHAWRTAQGLAPRADDERLVVLFCYDNPALPALMQALAARPTLLALTPGPAQAQVGRLTLPPRVRTVGLPWLPQDDFDRLLWSADLNLVRGEDSLVRALWAGKPLLWQLYPQADEAHHTKMEAFFDRWLEAAGGAGRDGAPEDDPVRPERAPSLAAPTAGPWRPAAQPAWVGDLRRLWRLWNGIGGSGGIGHACLPDEHAWADAASRASQTFAGLPELASRLLDFARSKAAPDRPAA